MIANVLPNMSSSPSHYNYWTSSALLQRQLSPTVPHVFID